MTPAPLLKATHKSIKAYYERLKEIHDQGASHEGAVREAFKDLLHDAARLKKWVLLTETSGHWDQLKPLLEVGRVAEKSHVDSKAPREARGAEKGQLKGTPADANRAN